MRIKFYRNKAGLTQDELAKNLNITKQTLARWENGISQLSISQATKIAQFFQVTVSELIGESISDSLNNFYFENGDESYFGEVGIKISVNEKNWYPISYETANDISGRLQHKSDTDNNWLQFETQNNKCVAVNLKNITSITLNDDNDDEPYGSYKISIFEEYHSHEFYESLP